jgi:hypothetical protein
VIEADLLEMIHLQVRPVDLTHELIASVDFIDVELAVKLCEPHG